MTNKRSPVSSIQNIFFDSEQVDNTDLTVEQNHNSSAHSGIINNHIGSGVLPEALNQNVLFDSLLVSGLLDGTNIQPQTQPSDNNLGNQLELELTDSECAGKKTVKVAIIGLDFAGNLQYETFVFKKNEIQVSRKHYASILTILLNDLIGPDDKSFNLGGRLVIREAKPFTVSRDPIMVAQDVEPNLFFRDFFVTSTTTLSALLKSALPLFNIDNLGINTGYKEDKILLKNDVSSQIGQKFLATTNNIQKVSLLLAVQNTDPGSETDLAWEGDLIISIYPLQSTTDCPTDLVPNLPIDYSPSNIPVAQLSINYTTLQQAGVLLDGTPQPVDFIFSNTPVATGNSITPGSYYALTVKRSGSATKCDILIASGSDRISDSRVTMFTGSVWVDLPEDDLWFRIYTDAVKVSDGQAYETGHGIIIPKTSLDSATNSQVDHVQDGIYFSGNELLSAVVSAEIEKSETVQDQRTGNPVFSRQQFVPNVKLLNSIDMGNLAKVTEPFAIGLVTDKNQKASPSGTISADGYAWSFIKDEFVIKLIDDNTDPRYNANVLALMTNIVNGDLTNAKFVPNTSAPNTVYRIAKAELCSMIYGDINGDGIVDDQDLELYSNLLEANLNISPPSVTAITTDGYNTTYTNGYVTYVNPFVNEFSLSFQLLDVSTTDVIASGSDGILVVNPLDGSLATFQSTSTDFSLVSNLTNLKLVLVSPTNAENKGAFFINSINSASNNIINVRKHLFDGDVITQILRADIDCDFEITSNDGYYLDSYIQKSPPFPATSLPQSRIGTKFNVIKLKLEPFLFMNVSTSADRTDDYSGTTPNRATTLHKTQDLFTNDAGLQGHNFESSPVVFNIVKQLTWEDNLITTTSNPRFVSTIFSSSSGLVQNSCTVEGISCEVYPTKPEFDPGVVDTFIPNNLIIGGELKKPDGDFYKVDFEVGTIVLEIPDGLYGTEKALNIFDDFVADYNGSGVTRLGFQAMRFADCSTVGTDALSKDQVRFSVAVQSFSPNTNGTDIDGYSGVIVDGKIGVAIDYSTGILTLNFTNLYEDATLTTLNTKVQISVYLKKGGFNNTPIFVDSTKVQNLLQLVSVFSGAGGNPPPAFSRNIIDLTGKSANGTSVSLVDSNGDKFALQNGRAYAVKATAILNRNDAAGRAMFINNLLVHCSGNIAVIDNDDATLVVANGEAWTVVYSVSGTDSYLNVTLTGTAGHTVSARVTFDWIELDGGV